MSTAAMTKYLAVKRSKCLAAIHCAKKDLGWDDDHYRAVLIGLFRKSSAGDLTVNEMKDLLDTMRRVGWNQKEQIDRQINALQYRAVEMASEMINGQARLAGLVKKICRVDRVEWCRDIGKLKKLLLVMERIG